MEDTNPNESANKVIWPPDHKNTFIHIEYLKLGVYDAGACFMKGYYIKIYTLRNLSIKSGLY